MNEVKLGEILNGNEQRDAVHVAIAPVIAAESLEPGTHVGFIEPGNCEKVGICDKPIGVIDPFLKKKVNAWQKCYLFLYPNTVTGMRHEWKHPAFGKTEHEIKVAYAKQFIEQEADAAGIDFEEIMSAAADYVKHDDYLCDGGRWEGHYLSDEFWDHYGVLTNQEVPENKRGSFFSCSC